MDKELTVNGSTARPHVGYAIETCLDYRSHWVAPDGRVLESRIDPATGMALHDLRPVLSLPELASFVSLAVCHLPPCPATPEIVVRSGTAELVIVGPPTPAWYGYRILTQGCRSEYTLTQMVSELTDDVPSYHRNWRGPFVGNRNRLPMPPGHRFH